MIVENSIYYNSIAYKELKSNGTIQNNKYCCIFVGEYFDSKKNNYLSNFTLPLSAIRLKPYSFLAKLQVYMQMFSNFYFFILFT